ncbi:MAG: HAD-IIB family hydrolase [Candidatus Thiodiazotropha sp.]|jgi:sucrose-6-phosphatase
MTQRLLICTDLDRTLLPNGPQAESSGARSCFAQLCETGKVALAYVSGRDRALVEEAIKAYDLPKPDYVIGDVGSTLYRCNDPVSWSIVTEWEDIIRQDWNGYTHQDLQQLFLNWQDLRLQEPNKQNRYKLSFYIDLDCDQLRLREKMEERLQRLGVKASLIWSVDEAAYVGLLDLLPQQATKYHAVEFLRRLMSYELAETLFSGDSGNDLDVLASPIPSVLVANAQPEVQQEARRLVIERGTEQAFYLAEGGYLGMNGCYSAGILEGVAHYHPFFAKQLLENGCYVTRN